MKQRHLYLTATILVLLSMAHKQVCIKRSLLDQCQPCQCYIGESKLNKPNATIANCSHRSFPSIPTHLPSTIDQLDLSSTGLLTVTASSLQKYPNLEVLILDNNKFDTLEKESFPDPCYIQMLSISGTTLRKITFDAFSNIPNVRKLTGLQTNVFIPGMFKHIPRLQELSLESNHALPNELLADTSLKSFNLYLNSSDSIPLSFFRNTSRTLHELRIIADQLDFLPADLLLNMTALRKFSIVVGEMEELPFNFFGEQEGSYCYISEISIMGVRKISENLFCAEPNLFSLTIHASETLESGAFHSLVRLHTLDLSHNRLSSVNPKWFLYITGLKELVLSFNKFTHLDSSALSGLRMLERLDVSHNFILSVHQNTFNYVHNTLTMLDLSHNHLGKIESDLFSEMVSLDMLDLSHNNLSNIPKDAFSDLYSLSKVELNSNKLTSLPEHSFYFLRSLEHLNLSSNSLAELQDGIFRSAPALKVLDLSNNRLQKLPNFFLAEDVVLDYINVVQQSEIEFVCDCTLVHLQLGTSQSPETLSGKCKFPLHVRGRPLGTLTLTEVCNEHELREYEIKDFEFDKTNNIRTTVRDIKEDLFNSGKIENSVPKILLILSVSCAVPVTLVGLLFCGKSLRGTLYSRAYYVNYDQRRI